MSTAAWPTSVQTVAHMYIAVNELQTSLNGSITSGATTLTLVSSTNFPAYGTVLIDNEVILYTGISGNDLTGLTRGFDSPNSTAAAHANAALVSFAIVADHHNILAAEINAIESSLNLTASQLVITNASGRLTTEASPSLTEIGFLAGVTSSIQTQLNGKGTGTVNSGTQYQLAYYATTAAAVSGDPNIVTDVNNTFIAKKNVYIGDGSSLSAPNGQLLSIVNDNNTTPEMIKVETYGDPASIGNQNDIHYIRARGTKASPLATVSGDLLASTGWRGYDGTAVTNSTLAFQIYALETFTPTAIGAKFHFEATPVGSVTRNAVLDIDAGGLTLLAGSKLTGVPTPTVLSDAVPFLQATVQGRSTTDFTTTSSSFQTTNCTASITPKKSTSRIRITITGTASVGASGHSCFVTIARGTTDLSTSGLGFVQVFETIGAGTDRNPCSISFIDSPATTSATTYNVRIKNDDNATLVGFGNTVDTVMLLEEII